MKAKTIDTKDTLDEESYVSSQFRQTFIRNGNMSHCTHMNKFEERNMTT